MLRITVELVPGGWENVKKTIAVAELHNVAGGAVADYMLFLSEDGVLFDENTRIEKYPRWAAPVWDLVARAIAKSLTGQERLPRRPEPVGVPVHDSDGVKYVRLSELPEPARSAFAHRMRHSTCPVIEEDSSPMHCFYASDWTDFLAGRK